MPVVISPIAVANAQSFHECLDAVARERRFLAATQALPFAQIEAFIRDNVVNDAVQFVALDGARVVGWADIFPHWADAIAHCGRLGMGILPEYRRQGFGEGLVRACMAKAKLKGITRIELEARADNLPAIRLYEKIGFVHEALKRNAMRFDGVYYDSIQMSLLLPE